MTLHINHPTTPRVTSPSSLSLALTSTLSYTSTSPRFTASPALSFDHRPGQSRTSLGSVQNKLCSGPVQNWPQAARITRSYPAAHGHSAQLKAFRAPVTGLNLRLRLSLSLPADPWLKPPATDPGPGYWALALSSDSRGPGSWPYPTTARLAKTGSPAYKPCPKLRADTLRYRFLAPDQEHI